MEDAQPQAPRPVPDNREAAPGGAAVRADELSLRGPRGWVYRDMTLAVPAGGLAAVSGVGGSGRTSLLLTLGGRMKPTSGTATVAGHGLPAEARAVQRIAALGLMAGITELEPALTVREHVSEALHLREGLFGRWRGRERRICSALDRVGLEIEPRTLAEELAPDEAQLLGVALALIGEPSLLLLDDVDEGLPADRQRALWERLRTIAGSGVTIIAGCHDSTAAAGLGVQVVELPFARGEVTAR